MSSRILSSDCCRMRSKPSAPSSRIARSMSAPMCFSLSPPAGSSGSAGDGTDNPPLPGDRPPADDDDIVARQLREAAENETDPVLREKLWQEYDKYKGSS